MNTRAFLRGPLPFLAGLLWCAAAQAQSCNVSATPLAFGNYGSPGGVRVDSSAAVLVTCTPQYLLLACKSSYTLSLSVGDHASGGQRQLAAGTGRLAYDLFSDSLRQQPWGDGGASGPTTGGTITTSLLNLVCLPGNKPHTVYGRIPANQSVPAGAYSDNVVLTVTY